MISGSRGWAKYYSSEGALFIRIGNLDYGTTELDLREKQFVAPPVGAEGIRTRVRPGDLLVSITGDTGMVGLAPEGLGDAYINQHVALARPAIPETAPYLALAFTSPCSLTQLWGAQRGVKNSLGLGEALST